MPKQSETHKIIWRNYLELFKNKLNNYNPTIYKDTDYTAVIVESRPHIDLEVVIKNVMYFLNESDSNINWGLKIFHTSKNKKYLFDTHSYRIFYLCKMRG